MITQLQRVVVGVCTCQRPIMLRACLDSLAEQVVPADVDMQIVVVDNESQPNHRAGVEAFAASCPAPVHYVHQPKRGIAAARNAVLDKAMELGTDWIAMIDDDEAADTGWIGDLMAAERRHLPILGGFHRYQYPEKLPFWMTESAKRKVPSRYGRVRAVGAGNIRISAEVIRAGVRFDERYGLLGGEDTRFCIDAAKLGFETHLVPGAITYGPLHRERMTYRGIVSSVYAGNVGSQRWDIHERGWFAVCGRTLPKAAFELVAGAVVLPLSVVSLLAGPAVFRAFALRGGKHLAKGLASISAAVGHLPQPYRHIVGH